MKIAMLEVMKDLENKPMAEQRLCSKCRQVLSPEPWTVRRIIVQALLMPEDIDGKEKMRRFILASRASTKDNLDLNHADIECILNCASKALGTLAYGRLAELLEG